MNSPTFPRHDVRKKPFGKSEHEIADITLHFDLVAVVGLFEDVMIHFVTEHLFSDELKDLGNQYAANLNFEAKRQLFCDIMKHMCPDDDAELSVLRDAIMRRIKNAQKFRNVSAHGGKFVDNGNNTFSWNGRNPSKQPRHMNELSEIMGNSAFDLVDDIKHYFSRCTEAV